MKAVVEDARFFKSCMDAIVNLVDEGVFRISSSGMHLRTMDPSQIAMIDFSLPRDAFSSLEVDGEAVVGLSLVDLSKILARTRAGEKLAVSLDEKASRLVLEFTGESKRSFRLPLLELSAGLPKEPKISFDATAVLSGGAFKEMLKDAGLLSSHVVLEADSNEFVVEAHGDSGDLRIESRKGGAVKELKAAARSKAMFPYEYLDDMTSACPDDAEMDVHLKTDAPVKISYKIGKAALSYYLAPRVETV